MIRRLTALALLIAGSALHAQTPCKSAGGRALYHISEFPSADGPSTAVYIRLANKTLLEILRRERKDGKLEYVPDRAGIRTKLVQQFGELCIASDAYAGPDALFVESSLRETLKQLTGTNPTEVGEAAEAASGQLPTIQNQKTEIERLHGKLSDLEERARHAPPTANEYSWQNPAFFFFVGMLVTVLVFLMRRRWRQQFFRKAKVPFPLARRLLINTKATREATDKLVDLQRPPTAKAIADAVVEGIQRGQTQAGTLLQLLADLPFHPQLLTADLRQRLVTAPQPTTDLFSQEEKKDLRTRQQLDNILQETESALNRVRDAVKRLEGKSRLRALLKEPFLAAMYHYDDDALSARNLGSTSESGVPEKAISVFRRLRRGELLLSIYLIPILPTPEVASAAWLLRSLQVAVNEMWVLLYLMGVQPDELVLLRQPPPDAEVKQISSALSTIREHFPDVSRLLQQETLSGTAVCDFEEIGYSFNNQQQRRSVVYELAHNKPPRETVSKPEQVALQESPRRTVQVVTNVKQEIKPAETAISDSPSRSLSVTLEAVSPQIASLRQLLNSESLSILPREDVRKLTVSIDNEATYREGIWQLSRICGTLFRKGHDKHAVILMGALKKCGVIFKDADIGEPAAVQSDFEIESSQKVMSQSLITEAEVRTFKAGAVVKQLAPFIAFEGRVQKGLVVVRFDF